MLPQSIFTFRDLPSVTEYFGYVFHFCGIKFGPANFYRDYTEFITGKNYKTGHKEVRNTLCCIFSNRFLQCSQRNLSFVSYGTSGHSKFPLWWDVLGGTVSLSNNNSDIMCHNSTPIWKMCINRSLMKNVFVARLSTSHKRFVTKHFSFNFLIFRQMAFPLQTVIRKSCP